MFKSKNTKCQHLRTCKEKQKAESLMMSTIQDINNDSAPTTVSNSHNTTNNTTNNTHTNSHNTNSHNTNTNSHNTTANHINIIVFNPDNDSIYEPMLHGHIDVASLRRMMFQDDRVKMLDQFYKRLLELPENRCVIKTNLKSSTSKVHIGNGIWEVRSDKDVYPKMVSQNATTFQHACHDIELENKRTQNSLDRFVDDICSGSGDPNDREMGRSVQRVLNVLAGHMKFTVFNQTKQMTGLSKRPAVIPILTSSVV